MTIRAAERAPLSSSSVHAEDFDDMLEELDREFRKTLKVAAKEYRAGKSNTLREYLKERLTRRVG